MDDSTKPFKIPLTCLILRFGAGDGAVLQSERVTLPLQCPYTVWMTSVLSKMGEGRVLSG